MWGDKDIRKENKQLRKENEALRNEISSLMNKLASAYEKAFIANIDPQRYAMYLQEKNTTPAQRKIVEKMHEDR